MTVDRAVAAVREPMLVEHLAPGMVRVVTFGDGHRVDVREGRCTCEDHQYREVRCKHIIRGEIETGRTPVPQIGGVQASLEVREPLPDFEQFQAGVAYDV